MTARDAARLLGVSRRTIYRWLDEGRLSWPIQIDAQNLPTPRPRGPRRNPRSLRYTRGRHSFDEVRGKYDGRSG